MKKIKLFTMAAVTIFSQLAAVSTGNAQVFNASVDAISVSTNSDGDLNYRFFDNRNLIRDCASEMGITNLTGLHLVYDLKTDALEVVSGTNDTVVCTPLSFSGGVFLSNTNATRSQRLAWVYWENNTVASGTLAATELHDYGVSNQLTGFQLYGKLQFALPGSGTNAPAIYQGGVLAGTPEFRSFGGK
ncbi:MAG TPA: hypothetical protein VMA35_04855 [Candidatus Sulfopaludibacter sp.]|nr:hypothetical protein [Candidatus Sulfopaludibacter sp.]